MADYPTADALRQIFDYDAVTGVLTWKLRSGLSAADKGFNSRHAGKRAGTLDSWGHRQVKIDKRLYLAHRLIWIMQTGERPPHNTDHIDGNRDNNSWMNLRAATPQQNTWNCAAKISSATGVKGVHFRARERRKPYRATIMIDRRRVYLGDFATLDEARDAYAAASKRHRGEAWHRA